MKTQAIKDGLQIFLDVLGDGWHVDANYEVILGPSEEKITPNSDAGQKLLALGWFVSEESGHWTCYT